MGESVGSFVAALLGGLSYLVPPALAVAGVLLIRGPRDPDIDLDAVEEDPDIVGGSHRNPAVIGLGVVLGVLVVAGMLDLLFAEQRTIDADGFDAYADGGGLLGAVPGGLAQVLGRWGAFAVLALLGAVSVSLVSGWSLRQMGQRVGQLPSPSKRVG